MDFMDLPFLRFYPLFNLWVIAWLYGLSSLIAAARSKWKRQYVILNYQDRFGNLLKIRLSGVAEQEYNSKLN